MTSPIFSPPPLFGTPPLAPAAAPAPAEAPVEALVASPAPALSVAVDPMPTVAQVAAKRTRVSKPKAVISQALVVRTHAKYPDANAPQRLMLIALEKTGVGLDVAGEVLGSDRIAMERWFLAEPTAITDDMAMALFDRLAVLAINKAISGGRVTTPEVLRAMLQLTAPVQV